MRDRLTTAGEVLGGLLVATGVALWSVPAGVVTLGVVLVTYSILAADEADS